MADRRLLLPEVVVPGHRLGRHINHDPESLRYKVTARKTPRTVHHERVIPIFDQGDLGSCTVNATLGVLGTEPFYSLLPDEVKALLNRPDVQVKLVHPLYREVTVTDPFAGSWEPDDTGSDGLSAAKVANRHEWISGYQHGTSLEDVLSELVDHALITGVMWMEGMDRPDSEGIVRVTGNARGGHEFVIDGADVERELLECTNSWGTHYARGGTFKIPFEDYSTLLRMQGDATTFVPPTAPPPQPEPPAAEPPFPFDKVDPWADSERPWWSKRNKTAAQAYRTWRSAVK